MNKINKEVVQKLIEEGYISVQKHLINRDGWTETLVCYKCTNEKLIPWLESQKVKPTESDLCSCEGLVCFPGSPIKCFTESQEDINQ